MAVQIHEARQKDVAGQGNELGVGVARTRLFPRENGFDALAPHDEAVAGVENIFRRDRQKPIGFENGVESVHDAKEKEIVAAF